jgi:glutamate N-acetyltransferase / amino-acid N-acetyltransferase
LDLGLIVSDVPAAAAGVFTRNLVKAAPIIRSQACVARGRARAILINAGQANACTGRAGLDNAARSARTLARLLGCPPEDILTASTGVIGDQLNMSALEAALPSLVNALNEEGLFEVAQAIMTTDTFPKAAEVPGSIDGRPYVIAGMAKGSGMICPDMATMLSAVVTDAAVSPEYLQVLLSRCVDKTFNRVTVDGDTSTNDCVLALANGQAGNTPLTGDDSPGSRDFEFGLNQVLAKLSRMIAQDGEGATKLIRVDVVGAVDAKDARLAAMTIANSPLVKTAFFGQDANWGRLMMALGRSGAVFDPEQVDIFLNGIPLVDHGVAAGEIIAADAVMKEKEIIVLIDLKAGPEKDSVLTCDFSLDYIKINADYRS